MLKDKQDVIKLNDLVNSLNKWSKTTKNRYIHLSYEHNTGSLYRFGWFVINGYKYAIVGWQFKEGIVTFENDKTHEKIKYDMINDCEKTILFKRKNYSHFMYNIKRKLSIWLKDLSDKLQP